MTCDILSQGEKRSSMYVDNSVSARPESAGTRVKVNMFVKTKKNWGTKMVKVI